MSNKNFVGRCPAMKEIRDYSNWVGEQPLNVRRAVISHGGWANVFPTEVKGWASSVRNLFNEVPSVLVRVNKKEQRKALRQLPHLRLRGESNFQRLKRAKALVGPVYKGNNTGSRYWYLMHPLGAFYHTGNATAPGWWDKFVGGLVERDDKHVVFKLVSPDGTGGSSEIIVKNWKRILGRTNPWGYDSLGGKPGKPFSVNGLLDVNPVTQGSYNYSESITQGIGPHELRDVKPHTKFGPNHYLPYRMLRPMTNRWFPDKLPRGF